MTARNKLLLISPKNELICKGFNYFPPISLGIIARLTPPDWIVDIIDENIEDLPGTDGYNLVGITTNTLCINRVFNISADISKKGIPVILGGSHASIMPGEALNYATAVVIGDVEELWQQVIHDYLNGNLKQIYSADGLPVKFVLPDNRPFNGKYLVDAIETSRGCTNNCNFCGVHVPFHKSYIRKPINLLMQEIESAQTRFIFFVDNNFFGNDEAYLYQLFEKMANLKKKMTWMAAVSVGFFEHPKLVQMAAKAGAKMFFIGLESDTRKTLNSLNKMNDQHIDDIFQKYRDIVKKCHRNHILISSNFIIGLDNDTEEIIKERALFFKKLHLDNCSGVILTPLPNTVLFKKLKTQNRLLSTNFPHDWDHYYYAKSVIKHDNLSTSQIEQIHHLINRGFKNIFFTMIRSLFRTRSFQGFVLYYYYCNQLANYRNKLLDLIVKLLHK